MRGLDREPAHSQQRHLIGYTCLLQLFRIYRLFVVRHRNNCHYCFKGCSGFTGNLVIPDQVATIEDSAFRDCEGFNGYLTIGSGISQIGSYVFSRDIFVSSSYPYSYNLPLQFTKVYCKATTPPDVSTSSFGSSSKYSYLGVPIGCKTAYDKEPWSSRFTIIEEIEF